MSSSGGGSSRRKRRRGGSSPPEPSSPFPDSSSQARSSSLPPEDDPLASAGGDSDEGSGEDLEENLLRDYRDIEELDRYDEGMLDQQDYEDMDADARRAAEEALAERERAEAARTGGRAMPAALLSSEADGDEPARKRARYIEPDGRNATRFLADDYEGEDTGVSLEELKGPVRDMIQLPAPRRELAHRFRAFLTSYVSPQGSSVYAERIRNMCAANRESLEVNYDHLVQHAALLAMWVADYPTEMLKIFDEVALAVVLSAFPDYSRIHSQIHVRITDLPIEDSLRDLRQIHLNGLVKVTGVVTRRTGVFPQLVYVKYDCGKCNFTVGPFQQNANEGGGPNIGSCPQCQSKGPFTVNSEQTVYRNYQKLTLQETPGTVPPGRLPRYKEIILLWDLIDSARPGEEIEVTGVYRNNFDIALNAANGFPVFSTIIEANYISKKEDSFAAFRLTDEDVRQIRELARDERINERIIAAIAPSIYGHEHIKTAVGLSLFGGQPKKVDEHRVRGDINVLMLGDPGTAKSQFLKYVEKTAHRAVFTTGQGASAVGLTAAVRKDPVTREWTLEGGALVLADQGVCLIDEFDKMNDQDRTSIHEAMEQQSISVSKAGIVATLQARCSIIAAANPLKGRYDTALPFNRNVDLTEPILSRFDVLSVVKDIVDPVLDERLANFVVANHLRSHPSGDFTDASVPAAPNAIQFAGLEPIDQDLLRKYIVYARKHVHPKLTNVDDDKIEDMYANLRRESQINSGMPMGVRHIESVLRLAEAHARMALRDYVRDDDVNVAMRVTIESFIACQKFSVEKVLRNKFQRYISYKKDNNELVFYVLSQVVREYITFISLRDGAPPEIVEVDVDDVLVRVRELDIHDLEPFFASTIFQEAGYKLSDDRATIIMDLGRQDRA